MSFALQMFQSSPSHTNPSAAVALLHILLCPTQS